MIDNIQEKKQAAASYILNFYNQILLLNDQYSRYINFLTEIQAKYGDEAATRTEIEERSNLIELLRNVRYVATNAQIQYNVICEAIKTDNKTILATNKTYVKIRDTFIIKRADLEEYVIILNKFLIENVIQELLSSSTDFLSQIFKENAPNPAGNQ